MTDCRLWCVPLSAYGLSRGSTTRTGKTLLYVSQQATIEILGLPAEENEALLADLFAHLYRSDVVMEHDWHKSDLVVWDNVASVAARSGSRGP